MADPAVRSNTLTTIAGRTSKSYLVVGRWAHFAQQMEGSHWECQHTLIRAAALIRAPHAHRTGGEVGCVS